MGTVADTLGIARTSIEFRGKVYDFPNRTPFEIEGEFERRLEQYALDSIERHRKSMKHEVYQTQLRLWQQDCAARVYEFGQIASMRALLQQHHQEYFLWLHCKYLQPDVSLATVKAMLEDKATNEKLDVYVESLLKKLPNQERPQPDTSVAG